MRMSPWTMQQPGNSRKRPLLMPQSQASSLSRWPIHELHYVRLRCSVRDPAREVCLCSWHLLQSLQTILLLKFSEGRIVGWLIDETRHVVCGLGADRSLRRSRQRSTRLVCNSSLCCPGALGTGHKSSSKLHHRSRQAGKAAFFIPSLTHASTFAMRHQSTRSRGCSADVVSYGVLHMLVALHFVGSECNGFSL